MGSNNLLIGLILLFVFNIQLISSQSDTSEQSKPFTFEISYLGDAARNNTGGIKTGFAYMGMANLNIGFSPEALGWWQGGEFYVHAANTHGKTPSADLIGDFQVASNIEAGNHLYIQELWYKQQMGDIELSIGQLDLNAEFISCDPAGLFLNSSLGISSLVSKAVPVSIFPLTTLGFTGKWAMNDQVALLSSIFDGDVSDFDVNKYNLNWPISKQNGFLTVSEIQLSSLHEKQTGTIKLGYFYHNKLQQINEMSGLYETIFDYNQGFYMMADQVVWQKEGSQRSINLFSQLALAPRNVNFHHLYFGFGANITSPFTKTAKDNLGIAIAHAHFNNYGITGESSIELTYQYQISNYFFVQPDIQYIIQPAEDANLKLDNALVSFLRFGFIFN